MYEVKNFYPKMQGKQLRLFLEDTVTSKNVRETEFIDAFKHLAPTVIKTIYSAHENVLEQWRTYPPHSNGTKARDLNDRMQKFILQSIPEYAKIDRSELNF